MITMSLIVINHIVVVNIIVSAVINISAVVKNILITLATNVCCITVVIIGYSSRAVITIST